MSELKCVAFCDSFGFKYAGVEYGVECFCGNKLGKSGAPAPEEECSMPCAGNEYELCGGPNRMNVFHETTAVAADVGPWTNSGPPGWGFMGCCTSFDHPDSSRY
jgi:hypothetical protein